MLQYVFGEVYPSKRLQKKFCSTFTQIETLKIYDAIEINFLSPYRLFDNEINYFRHKFYLILCILRRCRGTKLIKHVAAGNKTSERVLNATCCFRENEGADLLC